MEKRKRERAHLIISKTPIYKKWAAYNSKLDEVWYSESKGEMCDLILDNTGVETTEEAHLLLDLIEEGVIQRISFRLVEEEDAQDSH